MKSFIKRLVSSATSLVMITSCFAGTITTSAAQQSFILVEGSITATLDDNGTFTVTGKGEMPGYSTSGTDCPYNDKKTSITSVVISSGITSIGKFNFNNCTELENVEIADTVTIIGPSAFLKCTKATIDVKGTLIKDNIGLNAFGSTTTNCVKKIIVHDQETYEAVSSKIKSKTEVELQADAGSLKTELENLIKTTKETYKQEDYTADTYKTLSDALTKAETLVSQASPSTEEIQNATKAIKDAIGKLVSLASVVEGLKTELQSAIDKARAITLTGYTTSSKAALNKAISDAEAAIEDSGVTQEKLTQAKTALEAASAIDETGVAETGLKVKASLAGLSRRDIAIADAATIISRKDGYTEESYDVYKKVYDKLYELRNKSDDITDAQIDSIIAELEAAEQLEPVEIVLNTKEYEAVKKSVQDILNAENSPYTENSLRGATNSLTSLYNFQLKFVEDQSGKLMDGVLQSQIDSVTDTLKNAIDLTSDKCILVEKGDLTNLESLVESTKELTEANYTEETWTTLSDELTKANALINDPNNAAKADVDASEKTLKNAIDELVYKSADYTAVDKAIEKAPSDLSIYTDQTAKALKDAINAVDRNKNITEQADVDAFAKAIEDAIKALVKKSVSSSQIPGTSSKTSSKTVKSAAQLKAEKAMNQAKVKKLTVKSKAKKTIVVKWNKVKNAKGYQVQVSTKKTFKKLIINKKSVKKNKITVKNKKLKKGKKYFVRVRAYATYKNSKGVTKKAYSSWNKKLRTVKIK